MAETKNKKLKKLPIVPIVLLALVVVSTIGLYVFNFFLDKQIQEKDSEIQKVEESISNLKKDKNLQIYSLIEANKSTLEKMDKTSKITDYINHLDSISRDNSITFSDFNMSNGKITTQASSKNKTDKILAYMNVKNFIKKYREDENALFDLDFINSFEGTDTISFPVSFTIK